MAERINHTDLLSTREALKIAGRATALTFALCAAGARAAFVPDSPQSGNSSIYGLYDRIPLVTIGQVRYDPNISLAFAVDPKEGSATLGYTIGLVGFTPADGGFFVTSSIEVRQNPDGTYNLTIFR